MRYPPFKVLISFTFLLLNLRLYLIGGKSWQGVESGWAKTEVLTHYQSSTVKQEACRCSRATILLGKRMDQTLALSLVNWRISALHGYYIYGSVSGGREFWPFYV